MTEPIIIGRARSVGANEGREAEGLEAAGCSPELAAEIAKARTEELRGTLLGRVEALAGAVRKLEEIHRYHDQQFERVTNSLVDHNRQIHNVLAGVAELQRRMAQLEHQHEEWACHLDLVRKAQEAQAARVLDALAVVTADASTAVNLGKRIEKLEGKTCARE